MKRTAFFLVSVLVLNLIPFIPVNAQSDYVIDGDLVYIDDENVYIGVYPHTTSGGWVYLNFTSKRYSGELDFLFGFNSSRSYPVKAEWYNPHDETTISNYTIPSHYFSFPYMFNYTFESQDSKWVYDGVCYFWKYNDTSMIWDSKGSQRFEQANKNTYTLYWSNTYRFDWVRLTKKKLDWKKVNYVYGGMDRWFYFSHNVNEGQLYHLRIWLDVIPSLNGSINKFWFACKRSDQTIQQAISLDQFYALDPWYDTDWGYRKSHVINASSGAGEDYQIRFIAHYGSGTDSGEEFYCNSHCETDFKDIRFVNTTDNGLYNQWNATVYSSDNCTFWVKIDENLNSTDRTIYVYYGNSGSSSVSDFDNTFIFGDPFSSTTLDTGRWTSTDGNPTYSIDDSNHYLEVTDMDASEWFTGKGFHSKTFTMPYYWMIQDAYGDSNGYMMYMDTDGNPQLNVGHFSLHHTGFTSADRGVCHSAVGDYWGASQHYNVEAGVGGVEDYSKGKTAGASHTTYFEMHKESGNVEIDESGVNRVTESNSETPDRFHLAISRLSTNAFGTQRFGAFIIRKYVDPAPQHHTWGTEETPPTEDTYFYLTVYFDTGLIVNVNSSEVSNGSETAFAKDSSFNVSSTPENVNWEFLGFERVTYNNFSTYTPMSIDLVANETIWVYSQIEGEPLLYETVLLFSIIWLSLVFFSVFKPNLVLKGGAVIVGFILALDIHNSISTTFGSLLGFAVVCINVGLLVSVLFEK